MSRVALNARGLPAFVVQNIAVSCARFCGVVTLRNFLNKKKKEYNIFLVVCLLCVCVFIFIFISNKAKSWLMNRDVT